jgi:quercetin dioxygenase-like cupin family protein
VQVSIQELWVTDFFLRPLWFPLNKKERNMRFPDFIEKFPEADVPVPGVQAFLLQAPKHQVAFLRSEKDMSVPEHSHGAQWEIPVEGTAEIIMGGEVKVYGPGQPFYVPAGLPHAGKVKGPYSAIIFFDAPDRYKIKQ